MDFKKSNNLIGWCLGIVAMTTYTLSMEPSASFWDCGEYIACAYRLEIGHPPGAPFFMLVGRLFSVLGGTDPSMAAGMINVMSALCSAFTIMFLFWTITLLGTKIYSKHSNYSLKTWRLAVLAAGAIGALAFTFSDTFWFNAVEGEVYAMSSLFTAMVFWAILKWDVEDSVNPTGALRWIILISYLIGLSIGVHLLSLLAIPAICYVIYFKKYTYTRKGFFIAGAISLLLLFFVQNLIIPKIVKFLSDYEVFFTNTLKTGFSVGTVVYFSLLAFIIVSFILYSNTKKEKFFRAAFYSVVIFSALAVISATTGSNAAFRMVMLGGIIYLLWKQKMKLQLFNTIFLSFTALLIGYSSFFVLVIRSQANTPMDENDPENAPNMLSYLLREQYGEAPLLYGPYYNAPALSKNQYGNGDPFYRKDKANKNYKVLDSRKNSIPKFQKDFCTFFPRMHSSQQQAHIAGYKYWGNVGQNHNLKASGYGDYETVEVPNMKANLTYFFNYQVGYMYLRYFFWNFVGRQNDVQGSSGNNMEGNWISGIKFLDDIKLGTDSSKTIYKNANNFANNHFYGLPLVLGLCGVFFHFKRSKPDAWVVMCFFLLTGLAIIVYLNQSPAQVRERDYAYVGSFYAFAIWIGLGVLYVFEFIAVKWSSSKPILLTLAISLTIPTIMATQGWNDHNRSLRTLSRDSAINYLESCAPNAILFTNGDNDTFPLWYAQEVENIRTDVRVVCISLLSTDWFIKQVRRAAYLSQPVPFTIPEEKLEGEKMTYVAIQNDNEVPMNIHQAMDTALGDDPNTKLEYNGELLDVLPAKNFYVNVDSNEVKKNKVLSPSDSDRLLSRISWNLGNKRMIYKGDMMMLDLVANNNWDRPIYFTSNASDACVGLSNYLRLEGLAYRLVPMKQNEEEQDEGGMVNTTLMYDNIMHKFKWGGMNKKGVNLDENCLRIPLNLRMQMGILSNALIREGKRTEAKNVLDKCLEEMPDETVPFDATLYGVCQSYFELGSIAKARELSQKLFKIYERDLRIYNSQKANNKLAYGPEINQAKQVMRSLAAMAQHYQQMDIVDDFVKKMQMLMPEEVSPSKNILP